MDFTLSTYLIIIATVVISILWSLLMQPGFLFDGILAIGESKKMATSDPSFDPNVFSKPLADESSAQPIFFQWNGHSFEAFETLGLPAGSSKAIVDDAFQRMTATTDAASMLFFKAAYDAILKRL